MKEKTIIVGKPSKPIIPFVIGLGLFTIGLLIWLSNIGGCRVDRWESYNGIVHEHHRSLLGNMLLGWGKSVEIIIAAFTWLGIFLIILGVLYYICHKKVSITVTDKRVYGSAAWGKRVDLPLDMISSVGTSFLKGITVATSSGKISFKPISNNTEVHEAIGRLLLDRQETNSTANKKAPSNNFSSAEELKQYKDLLDSGVITLEEFDAKKKQLLGL